MRCCWLVVLAGCAAAPAAKRPSTPSEWSAYAQARPESGAAQVYSGYAALDRGDAAGVDAALDRASRTEGAAAARGALALEAGRRERTGERRRRLLENASRDLAAARRSYPDDRAVAFNFGLTLLCLERPAEAVEPLEAAALAKPIDRAALRLLARAQLGAEDPLAALDVVRREDAATPLGAEDRLIEGDALFLLRRFEEAAGAYRVALGRGEDRPLVWNNLGLALRELGREGEAKECLERSRALREPRRNP